MWPCLGFEGCRYLLRTGVVSQMTTYPLYSAHLLTRALYGIGCHLWGIQSLTADGPCSILTRRLSEWPGTDKNVTNTDIYFTFCFSQVTRLEGEDNTFAIEDRQLWRTGNSGGPTCHPLDSRWPNDDSQVRHLEQMFLFRVTTWKESPNMILWLVMFSPSINKSLFNIFLTFVIGFRSYAKQDDLPLNSTHVVFVNYYRKILISLDV